MASDPQDDRVLYAGTRVGVLVTRDGGSTWTAMSNNGVPEGNTGVGALAVAPTHPATVYADIGGYGVYKYTGKRWVRTGAGYTRYSNGGGILALIADPHTPTTLYSVALFEGVTKSTDAGRTWVAVNEGLGGASQEMRSLAIDPTNPTILYASAERGIFKTTDGALTWKPTGFKFAGELPYLFVPIVVDPHDANTVYVGPGRGSARGLNSPEWKDKQGSVFKTTDGGDTWHREATFFGNVAASISADPRDPRILYAGTSGGVFASTDAGTTWVLSGLEDADVCAVALDPAVPGTMYAGSRGHGVFKTTDSGATWREASDGLTGRDVLSLRLDPLHGGILYAGTTNGLFKSADAGGHWTVVRESRAVYAVEIAAQNPETLYAGVADGVLKSMNGGSEWIRTNLNEAVFSLAIHPSGTLYAGTCRGVLKSVDRGDTWQPSNAGIERARVYSLIIDRDDPNTIYIGTLPMFDAGGILKSSDGGITWNWMTDKHGGYPVRALAVTSLAPHSRTIYAATLGEGVIAFQDSLAPHRSQQQGRRPAGRSQRRHDRN